MDDVTDRAKEAARRFDAKDIEGALALYAALATEAPDNAEFASRQAVCLLMLSRWEAALPVCQAVLERHGPTKWRVTHLAICQISLQNYEAVRELCAAHGTIIDDGPPPRLLVYACIAAMMLEAVPEATGWAARIQDLVPAERGEALHELTWRLEALSRQGHGKVILRALAGVAQALQAPPALLRLGLNLARAHRDGKAALYFAQSLAPDGLDGLFEQAQLALELEEFAEMDRILARIEAEFPAAGRTPQQDRRAAGLEVRRSGIAAWQRQLSREQGGEDFAAANARICAHMTLLRTESALALAHEAVVRYDSHPWFLLLAARCESRLGKPAAAAELAARAVARDPNFMAGWAELCRFHKQAGALEAARTAALQLARLRPHLPVMKSFFNAPDEPPALPAAPWGPQAWLHGGDSGDLIYALAVMRDLGGPLYLGCLDGVREPMVDEKIAFLRPLLTAQPYVHGVHVWQGEAVSMDCSLVRLFPQEAGVNLTTMQWRVLRPGAPDLAQAWLAAPGFVRHGRPVFARTARYRNPGWDSFWTELKQAAPDAIFVGTAAEYEDFGHGEFRHAQDALELARIIAGASVFAGNQSLPYAIAEGLKVGRLLEAYPPVANCNFPGALPLGFNKEK